MEFLKATYLIETPLPVDDAAAVLAGEQSSGTFVSVPGETAELRERYAARVESVEPLEDVDSPSLPGCRAKGEAFHRAHVTIAWPAHNFGPNLPTILSTVGGNLFELSQLSGVKLLDLEFPESFGEHFRGPAHGVRGSRRATGVEGRPLIGTIIKPSVGLTPEDTAAMVKVLCDAGIDFIKDDELMANPPHSPFDKRVDAVMRVVNDHAEKTGKRVMMAFNITDERDEMCRHYNELVAQENTCAMVSLNSIGVVGVKEVCDWGMLVIHGHRNGWGMFNRCPTLGMGFAAYQKLWRLAGVDQLHVNGIANKFWEPDDSVVASIASCLAPMWGDDPLLPVVSSGQWGGQAFETYRRTQTTDLLYMAGGGIMAHPSGPAAGVRSLQQAWQAAIDGFTLEQAAKRYTEFGRAVEKFGRKP
ncbi:Ribulose bisphosphate carboxylase-like protein [Posidoniimonas polymericola]|uniref:Ribulose bisphosphate carboxylase-like protein n=1 Tax=Posidoniimonas polymericola TaxID=2528002 RepID=A0A5C5ZF49_9BACT|nr:ribulose-bisphosphate carboxylase large subunit family protein [Posidoniimonas polymericola]TWT86004.1 Ribulose bisphosphate carboxylase-like protein [Posidoniimonas polymericola]